ncbi:efflux RND transporter periplasmic adaptor subunit [Erwinia amylovora]
MTFLRSKPIVILGTLLIAGALYRFWPQQPGLSATTEKSPPALVSLVSAQVKPLPLTLMTQGHVISLNQVDIQAQITGTVKSVAFREGDFVQKGQLLFTLDDASQQAALHHAVATLAESRALLNKAQRDVNRGQSLRAKNYISSSDWDTLQSSLQQYDAQYKAAQEDIRTAQVQLDYTRITAPVSGKTGALNVHPGSLVQPGSTLPLVAVNQFDPIGVAFTLPEKDLNAVLAAQANGPVQVWVNNARGNPIAGTLDFIDNSVSTDSGTISLKARFSNSQHLLWPGVYQAVKVEAGITPRSVVLPPQAIQNGPDGHFVFIIDGQNHVATTPVNLLRIQQQMAVVEGLAQGTEVVLEGANNLRPGMAVKVAKNEAREGQN